MSSTAATSSANPPSLVTKHTEHALRDIVLGQVTGMMWMGDMLVLYYTDHQTVFKVDEDGEILIAAWEPKTC